MQKKTQQPKPRTGGYSKSKCHACEDPIWLDDNRTFGTVYNFEGGKQVYCRACFRAILEDDTWCDED